VRNCQDAAEEQGWSVLPNYIRTDEGISGATLASRNGLLSLLEDAKKKPRPFDCLVIDSTSRFARDRGDVMTLSKKLRYCGVFLYFVAEGLDTREPSSKNLQMLYGMRDEDFLDSLRHNVHRGQKGAVLQGHHAGGTHYGYRGVPVPNPLKKNNHTGEAVAHVYLEINPEQAAIILQIFEMRVRGTSLSDITKHMTKNSVPGPRGGAWSYSGVKRILRDELYIGIKKWNRTKNERDPESGKIRQQPRPASEWVVTEHPELRIVPQDLWAQVQAINSARQKIRQSLGGMNRTDKSKTYLFSGRLKCGLCGRTMCIIGGGNYRPRYGCPAYRFEGNCSNSLTIYRDTLEEQLLDAITRKLESPAVAEYIDSYKTQIKDYLLSELDSGKLESAGLEKRLTELKKEQSNVTKAIAKHGLSEALDEELTRIESEIRQTREQVTRVNNVAAPALSFEDFQSYVQQKANEFKSVLKGDPAFAKQAISRIMRRLLLTPIETPDGQVFAVSGDIALFVGESGVLLGSTVERSAKHYTPILSLTGLQLDPKKPAEQRFTRSNKRKAPSTRGEMAPPDAEMVAV